MPGDTPFDAALAALDVEPTHHTDRMVTTYDILGLDAVRAAHRADVDAAVARVAKLEAALRFYADDANYRDWANRHIADGVPVVTDEGAKARAALEEPRKGDSPEAAEEDKP